MRSPFLYHSRACRKAFAASAHDPRFPRAFSDFCDSTSNLVLSYRSGWISRMIESCHESVRAQCLRSTILDVMLRLPDKLSFGRNQGATQHSYDHAVDRVTRLVRCSEAWEMTASRLAVSHCVTQSTLRESIERTGTTSVLPAVCISKPKVLAS